MWYVLTQEFLPTLLLTWGVLAWGVLVVAGLVALGTGHPLTAILRSHWRGVAWAVILLDSLAAVWYVATSPPTHVGHAVSNGSGCVPPDATPIPPPTVAAEPAPQRGNDSLLFTWCCTGPLAGLGLILGGWGWVRRGLGARLRTRPHTRRPLARRTAGLVILVLGLELAGEYPLWRATQPTYWVNCTGSDRMPYPTTPVHSMRVGETVRVDTPYAVHEAPPTTPLLREETTGLSVQFYIDLPMFYYARYFRAIAPGSTIIEVVDAGGMHPIEGCRIAIAISP